METMKGIRVHSFGGPEVLQYEDIPRPEPAADEVLIRVHATGVNPVDWKMREGRNKNRPLPLIPGWDLSGVIESVGKDVTDWKNGDEVYSRPDISRDGAYAEYIVVRASEIARKPKSLDHTQAASIPLASLTAWQVLFDAVGLKAGQRVLIHAAAGGVGHFAVQLAKWKGAYVIGTASKHNHDFLREIGADETIDYDTTRFEDVVNDVDMVFDTQAGETRDRSWQVLKKGGILVSIVGHPSEEDAAKFGVRAGYVLVRPNRAELDQVTELVDSGKLKAFIQQVFPLAEARKAQELSQERHTRGKLVLRVV
jgi:NADPH:quinone reductase-like Zn-dependent oxidoreductase